MMNNSMMFNQNNFNPMLFNMILNMMNNMYPNMGYNTANYNMNNPQYNMNLMMNWMNMNPILFQMYQMMMNQFNNNKNNNIYNNNYFNNNTNNNNKMNLIRVSEQDLNQAKVTGGGVISNKVPNNSIFDISPFDTNIKINIAFTTQKGQKVNVITPVNMRMNDLFVKYITRLGLGPNLLGQSIFFLYNGSKIKVDDKRTVAEMGLVDGSNVIVLDLKGVIGS